MIKGIPKRGPATVLWVAMISGCAVTTEDPSHDGSLWEAMVNTSSGAYDRRAERQQTELTQSIKERERLEREHQAWEAKEAKIRREKERLSGELRALAQETQKQARALAQLKAQNAAAQRKKDDLNQQLADVNAKLTDLQQQSGGMTVADYKRRKALLDREVQALWIIINSL